MGIVGWLKGMITAELYSADIHSFLSAAQQAQIELENIQIPGSFALQFQVERRSWNRLCSIAERRGERLTKKNAKGLYWLLYPLRKRPVLVIGLLALIILALYAPTRVFFVTVEGNLHIPTRKIVEAAGDCGICFGASMRQVRSEKMKNALLEAMPELAWAGVNTYGCCAVISVQEREIRDTHEITHTVSSVVAARDGVIVEMTVLQGNRICTIGQVVKQGQVLISGYTDCGISIQATQAKGEVYAYTTRQTAVLCPTIYDVRGAQIAVERKFSLIIGNKRINFSNSSGISGTGCAKIYEENYIVLPGGFSLPLAICVETWTSYEMEPGDLRITQDVLSEFSITYLQSQMCAGQILRSEETFMVDDGILQLLGRHSCIEMIGITRLEENLLDYVENH